MGSRKMTFCFTLLGELGQRETLAVTSTFGRQLLRVEIHLTRNSSESWKRILKSIGLSTASSPKGRPMPQRGHLDCRDQHAHFRRAGPGDQGSQPEGHGQLCLRQREPADRHDGGLGRRKLPTAMTTRTGFTGLTQGTSTASLSYDTANRRTSLTLPNGVVIQYGYDLTGNRTRMGGTLVAVNLPMAFSTAN